MTGDILKVFAANAAIIFVLALAMWAIAVRIRDPSFIDTCWGLGFVVIVWSTFLMTNSGPARRPLLVVVTTLWGLRLGGYLFWRWRKQGPDARYVAILKHAANPKLFMLRKVFLFQAALMLVVALPLEFGQVYDEPSVVGLVQVWGLALAGIGLAFEWTGDFQLVRFKADSANHGDVMDKGLWRFTRHPNYFGDFCVWWGLFGIAYTNPVSLIAVVGPVAMSVLLMRVSGVGPLERQLRRTKPAYADYVHRTSAFFPSSATGPKLGTAPEGERGLLEPERGVVRQELVHEVFVSLELRFGQHPAPAPVRSLIEERRRAAFEALG